MVLIRMSKDPSASVKPLNQALLNILLTSGSCLIILKLVLILIQSINRLNLYNLGVRSKPLSKFIILIKPVIEVIDKV